MKDKFFASKLNSRLIANDDEGCNNDDDGCSTSHNYNDNCDNTYYDDDIGCLKLNEGP